MAEGVNYALAQAVETGDKIARANQMGLVRSAQDTYADGGAANTVVYMFDKLPDGAVVLGLYLDCDYADSGLTLDIGDAEDIDRYIDGADASGAINGWQSILVHNYVIGTNAGDNQIQVKLLGATASGDLKMTLLYSI